MNIRIDAPTPLIKSLHHPQHRNIAESQAIGSIIVQCRLHRGVASDGAGDGTASWRGQPSRGMSQDPKMELRLAIFLAISWRQYPLKLSPEK